MPRTAVETPGRPPQGAAAGAGFTAADLAAWVAARYVAGDRRLVVTDWAGAPVAGIGRDPATGARTWWADPTWPEPDPHNDDYDREGG